MWRASDASSKRHGPPGQPQRGEVKNRDRQAKRKRQDSQRKIGRHAQDEERERQRHVEGRHRSGPRPGTAKDDKGRDLKDGIGKGNGGNVRIEWHGSKE